MPGEEGYLHAWGGGVPSCLGMRSTFMPGEEVYLGKRCTFMPPLLGGIVKGTGDRRSGWQKFTTIQEEPASKLRQLKHDGGPLR